MVAQLGQGMAPWDKAGGTTLVSLQGWSRSVTLAALLVCCEMRLPHCPYGALNVPISQAQHCATVTSTRAGCPPTSSTAARWPLLRFAPG